MSSLFVSTSKGPRHKVWGLILLVILGIASSCSSPRTPETHTIVIKGMKFLPEVLVIQKGDTVEWINKDLVDHDVTEEKTEGWTSGTMKTNDSWKKAITENQDYFCNLHVVMKGKITVE